MSEPNFVIKATPCELCGLAYVKLLTPICPHCEHIQEPIPEIVAELNRALGWDL